MARTKEQRLKAKQSLRAPCASGYNLKRHIEIYFKNILPAFNHIEGDYVELGFGCGYTAEITLRMIREGRVRNRELWVFDSFKGFPTPTKEDMGGTRRDPRKGEWNISHRVFEDLKAKYSDITMYDVPGYFDRTVPYSYAGDGIAILHLDCDLYESYKQGFQLIDQVVPGGVVLLDEYHDTRWPGATKAIDEQFPKEEIISYLFDGQSPKHYWVKPYN